MTQRHFFALPEDLLPVFQLVEAKHRIYYALTGLFDSPEFAILSSAALPSLHSPASDASINCATYLVIPSDAKLQVRPVQQVAGDTRYAVNQLINPDSITLTHGGLHSPGILISGRVATVSGTPVAKTFQSAFSVAIAKLYTRQVLYVGPCAAKLLHQGCRLTQGRIFAGWHMTWHGSEPNNPFKRDVAKATHT